MVELTEQRETRGVVVTGEGAVQRIGIAVAIGSLGVLAIEARQMRLIERARRARWRNLGDQQRSGLLDSKARAIEKFHHGLVPQCGATAKRFAAQTFRRVSVDTDITPQPKRPRSQPPHPFTHHVR